MSETDAALSALGKWIRTIYVLAGLQLLLTVILSAGGYVSPYDAFDPVVLLFLAATALVKRSRGCVIALGLLSALNAFSGILNFSDSEAFLKPFPYENETKWAFLAVISLTALAAANGARILFRFHRAAGTRIVWRNVGVAVFAIFLYAIVLVVLGILVSFFLPADMSDEGKGLVLLGPVILVVALAIWRKLPGTSALPAVVAAGEDADPVQPGTFAGDFNLIALSSSLEGTEGEDRIVSPFGIFGRAYRLSGEQYAVFLEWQKTERKKHSWVLALLFPLVMVGGFAGAQLSGLAGIALSCALLVFAWVSIAYSVRKQRVGFRERFPDAPEATRQPGSRADKLLFGYGAGIPGKLWHQILCVVLFLFFGGLGAMIIVTESVKLGAALIFGAFIICILLVPTPAIIAKRRFRRRYGLPLTAENLWKVRSAESPSPESR